MVVGSVQNAMRTLRAVQVLLALAILWASWGVVRQLRGSDRQDAVMPMQTKPSTSTHPAGTAQTLDWYAPIWQRNWKQPLIDPPPPAPKVEVSKPPPAVRVRLVGTMIENGTCYGVFMDENKQLKIKAVNETIDLFTITAIERGRAELVQGERRVWLEVPVAAKP